MLAVDQVFTFSKEKSINKILFSFFPLAFNHRCCWWPGISPVPLDSVNQNDQKWRRVAHWKFMDFESVFTARHFPRLPHSEYFRRFNEGRIIGFHWFGSLRSLGVLNRRKHSRNAGQLSKGKQIPFDRHVTFFQTKVLRTDT